MVPIAGPLLSALRQLIKYMNAPETLSINEV